VATESQVGGIQDWDPEDEQFWEREGEKIARRNLWISIPNLLLGFAVWIYWGMIAKAIQHVHFATVGSDNVLFDFTFMNDGASLAADDYKALMYVLPAVAGLAGATLRIPHSFMVSICGGKNSVFLTTAMLLFPAVGAGIALQNPDTPFSVFMILAALSGFGGGAFASSMSNISFFYPKKQQGLALGLNAGIGNLGVSLMQFLLPWIVTFGAFGGEPYTFTEKLGEEQVNQSVWLQNAGLVWVPILISCSLLAFFLMNNLAIHRFGSSLAALAKYFWLTVIGLLSAGLGVCLLVIDWGGFPKILKSFVIVVFVIGVTLTLMRFATPKAIKEPLQEQFAIFSEKHNWIMTYLYVMTFGSFIGYSSAFPKLIDDVFGSVQLTGEPTGLKSAGFIWIGAGVGAILRPIGGWLGDKFGGARVTHWSTLVMVGATIAAGYLVTLAMGSDDPTQYFIPFLLTFILLFAMTGIGNGSTFRMIGVLFERDQRGPVLGWTSAVAAYGAFLIPMIFAAQIAAKTPQYALYGFAAYYLTCLVINWWFYYRRNAERPC
jgi:MFS transporter, NNP family, nitrate/nitrite transporter